MKQYEQTYRTQAVAPQVEMVHTAAALSITTTTLQQHREESQIIVGRRTSSDLQL